MEQTAHALGPARSHPATQTAQPRSKPTTVGPNTLRALESLLAEAFRAAQQSGSLPAAPALACDDAAFIVSVQSSTRHAATHYTSSILKAATAYNARHFPLRSAEHSAANKANKGGKKQKIKAHDGSVTVKAQPRGDAGAKAEHKPATAATTAAATTAASAVMDDADDADTAGASAAASAASAPPLADSTTLPFADVQSWAVIVADQLSSLLASLDPAHPLYKRVTCSVPAADASVRGAGFVDFVIQPDPLTDADASAASSSSSAAAASSSSSAAAAVSTAASSASPPLDAAPLATATSFTFDSIGSISSVFKLKYGTPRQGTIAPNARGSLTLRSDIPASSLEGLEEYSHLWLVFVFHRNENKSFRPKIEPPRAGGRKLGVFATRSPHRLNPIGLSLVKLERVDLATRTLHLSSLDLIEGTPVLDIKPYHPADCQPHYTLPLWMQQQAEIKPPFAVRVSAEAEAQLRAMVQLQQLQFYTTFDDALASVRESVSHDPRPIYVRARASREEVYGFRLDRMNVLYRVDDASATVDVVAVQYVDYARLMAEQREEQRAAAVAAGGEAGSAAVSSQSLLAPDEEYITKKFLQQRPKRVYEINGATEAAETAAASSSTAAAAGATAAAAPASSSPAPVPAASAATDAARGDVQM